MDLGFTEVPCAVVDIDKTREKALNIALNKITGAWDENLLAELLKDIQDSDFDLGKTGFDPPEIETLFNKVHSKDVQEDDFDVEGELSQPVFSHLGDLWQLEANRAGLKQRLDELEAFLAEQTTEVTEYDEGLVRQLIEKITVYDDHLAFEFKSGLETEVQM